MPTVMRPVFRKFQSPGSPQVYFISHYAEVTNDWRKWARRSVFMIDQRGVVTAFSFLRRHAGH